MTRGHEPGKAASSSGFAGVREADRRTPKVQNQKQIPRTARREPVGRARLGEQARNDNIKSCSLQGLKPLKISIFRGS